MKIMGRMGLGLTISCIWALWLTGCGAVPNAEISDTMMEYNRVVEKTQNEMLLLNIVRASKRHPMYFTSFNLLRGSLKYDVSTGSLVIPFGKVNGGDATHYSFAPNMSFSNNPSFDVVVLDNKEFVHGFLSPMTMDQVAHLIELGWKGDEIGNLVIDRIEEDLPGCESRTFVNDVRPKNHADLEIFQMEVHRLFGCGIERHVKKVPVGPPIPRLEAEKVETQTKAREAKLEIEESVVGSKEPFQLFAKESYYVPRCVNPIDPGHPCCGKAELDQPALEIRSGNGREFKKEDGKGDICKVWCYLRSVEGVLYYLAEILRWQERAPPLKIYSSRTHRKDMILFLARKATAEDADPQKPPPVAVEYDGVKYVIPYIDPEGGSLIERPSLEDRSTENRSMEVLTFVSYALALQKSAEPVPQTGAVTVVGGR